MAWRWLILLLPVVGGSSCRTLEQAAAHGFSTGTYRLHTRGTEEQVYVEVEDGLIRAYPLTAKLTSYGQPAQPLLSCSLLPSDSACHYPFHFSKTSLDIDLTSVLLKYRAAAGGLPGQATTDFNAAIYVGPRFDRYEIRSHTDPLGKCRYRVYSRGFDAGLLAGMGTTPVNPFTTRNQVSAEYNALIIQVGAAAFAETSFASFGLAAGIDYLTGRDRRYWIYQGKPWVGLVVGIALN